MEFQRRLADEHIEFSDTSRQQAQVAFLRSGGANLKVQLGLVSEQAAQLLVIAATDAGSSAIDAGVQVEPFKQEVESVFEVFQEVWPEPMQVLSRDAALHLLFDCGVDHAFQFLWEERLHQEVDALQAFGRPIGGGGLRFVMPATSDQPDPFTIEVKIESFLRDPSKIYVDTIMQWHKPQAPRVLDPTAAMDAVESYTESSVIPFITQGRTGDDADAQ